MCGKSTRPVEALGLRVEIPKNEDFANVNNRTPIRRCFSTTSLTDCYDCTGHQLQDSLKNHSVVSFPRQSPREISPKQIMIPESPSSTISDVNDDGYLPDDGEAVDTFDQIMITPLANATIVPRSFLFRGCLKNPLDAEDRDDFVVVKQENQNKKTVGGAGADTLRDSSDYSYIGLSLSSPNPLDPSDPNNEAFDDKPKEGF